MRAAGRYALGHAEGKLTHALVQTFKVATQPEACVADDAAQRLFIGEEKRGVWVMNLAVPVQTAPKLLMAMPIGGLLLIAHWLLVVRDYIRARRFAGDDHFDANASASL